MSKEYRCQSSPVSDQYKCTGRCFYRPMATGRYLTVTGHSRFLPLVLLTISFFLASILASLTLICLPHSASAASHVQGHMQNQGHLQSQGHVQNQGHLQSQGHAENQEQVQNQGHGQVHAQNQEDLPKGDIESKGPFQKGRSIMEEVEKRAKSASEHIFLSMIIRDAAKKERKRSLEVWNEYQNGKRKNLMRFTGPQMVKNTGLLSLEREAGEDDQWLYLPILRKSKRIAAAAKTNEFVGTDFTFEDLSAENIDDFKYEFQGEQEIGGNNCFVVKAVPLEERKKSTGYKERIIFVRKDIYAPVEIHHYDWNGTFYKKWLASDLVNVKGKCWRANREEMVKIIETKGTILLVDKRITKDTIDDNIFTQRELTKEY